MAELPAWIKNRIAGGKRRALPLLSYPAVRLLGVSVRDLISDSGLQAQGMYAVAKRCPAAAAVSIMDLSVEAECFGSAVQITDDEAPAVLGAVVRGPEDAKALKVPDMGAGRTGLYVEAVSKALKLIDDRPVFAGMIGPFSLACRLMDMAELMFGCYDDPETVHTVLKKSAEFLKKYAKAYKDAGANGIVLAEPAAGLLSPALCAEFSSSYVGEITKAVQDDNFLVIYHNCGNAVNLAVPEMLSTGCLAYHFGNAVSMEEMLKKMPGVLVMGNLDPVSDFLNGSPEKVRADTLALLSACASCPNFLISSGCDIPPAAPWENIDAFFGAVREFYI